MKSLRKFKIAMLLVLIGIGMSSSLSACVLGDGGRGGYGRR